jgi:hypothetical protein
MNNERIDFISSYCDRWCERCAFTDRCSAFACEVAIAMCGNAREGLELAVGRPCSVDGHDEPTIGERLLAEIGNQMPTDAEMAELRREEQARDARIEAIPVARMSDTYMHRSKDWIDAHAALEQHADAIVREAFAVVCHDAFFIAVKLRRALNGRDRRMHGEEGIDEDRVQNDWNGSAKIALISIERSAEAWKTVGAALNDGAATALGEALDVLRRSVLTVFPDAMSFRRPGFDDLTPVGRQDA